MSQCYTVEVDRSCQGFVRLLPGKGRYSSRVLYPVRVISDSLSIRYHPRNVGVRHPTPQSS